MVLTQRLPWASGKKKPVSPGGQRPPQKRRRRRKMSSAGKALTGFFAALGAILLALSQIFQMAALIFVGLTSMLLGAITMWSEMRQDMSVPPPAAARPKAANPGNRTRSGGGKRQPGTAVICTQTGQPTDKCTANHNHVMSNAGLDRYRKNHNVKKIGDPYGTKPSQPGAPKVNTRKSARVPTTRNAKPLPPGEHMRRVV